MRIVQNPDGGLTRKELAEKTGCQGYLIAYYTSCGYLPILRPSTGPGNPVIYHLDAIKIIQARREANDQS